jgi:polyferredoxin
MGFISFISIFLICTCLGHVALSPAIPTVPLAVHMIKKERKREEKEKERKRKRKGGRERK